MNSTQVKTRSECPNDAEDPNGREAVKPRCEAASPYLDAMRKVYGPAWGRPSPDDESTPGDVTHDTPILGITQDTHEIFGRRTDTLDPHGCGCAGTGGASGKSAQGIDGAYARFRASIDAGRPFDLPLGEHIRCSVHFNRDELRARAERGDEPYSPLYIFIRAVKSHPEVVGLDAEVAFGRVRMTLRINFGHHDPWSAAFGLGADDAETEFLDVWDRIQTLYCRDPLADAVARARMRPVDPPRHGAVAPYKLFVGTAAHLQLERPGQPILLPVHQLAPHLGVEPMTVTRYRRWAVDQRLILKTRVGRYVPGGKGEADEFTFDLTRFPSLTPGT